MKILVATRNADKFKIVKDLVEFIVPDAQVVSLSEAQVPGDVVEVGTIEQRAVQKAEYFAGRVEHSARPDEFDCILAVDDGLQVGNSTPTPNSKELTDRILATEWPVGTPIAVVRAFALIRTGELTRVETTFVPFEFIGNPSSVRRSEGMYPLVMYSSKKERRYQWPRRRRLSRKRTT